MKIIEVEYVKKYILDRIYVFSKVSSLVVTPIREISCLGLLTQGSFETLG